MDVRRSLDEIVVTLTCPDQVGIVFAVSGYLAQRSVNIIESHQFADPSSGQFFMRIRATLPPGIAAAQISSEFDQLARQFDMVWDVHDLSKQQTVIILVSNLGHCLNDLLYRNSIGALNANIAAVVSNHQRFEALTRSHGIEFVHLPVSPDTKLGQEAKMLALVEELEADFVILARYMQILSGPTVEYLTGRAINIHHSFLPSFKGARPYHQAYERGVKLIGATAHYVTTQLDEGPIIEQEVARVDHSRSPDELVSIGRDIENVTLARAVGWHIERRVMLNGNRTVVFR